MEGVFTALSATMMANPIAIVIAAITTMVAAFVYLWNTNEEFRQFWIRLWNGIKEIVVQVWTAISQILVSAWNGILNTISSVVNRIKNTVSGAFNAMRSGIQSTILVIYNTIRGGLGNVQECPRCGSDCRYWGGVEGCAG